MKKAYRFLRARLGSLRSMGFKGFILIAQLALILYLCCVADAQVWQRLLGFVLGLYHYLSQHGWWVVAGLLFMPTFGLPISPLWILAGTLWGVKLGFFISFVCLGFSLIFSYIFYKKCLNKLLFTIIFRGKKVPSFRPTSRLTSMKWVLLIQLVPQIPYVLQCYVLSTLREVQFVHYLSLSWIFQAFWAYGFIYGGNILKTGQWGMMLFVIIFVGAYLTYKGYRYYKDFDKPSC